MPRSEVCARYRCREQWSVFSRRGERAHCFHRYASQAMALSRRTFIKQVGGVAAASLAPPVFSAEVRPPIPVSNFSATLAVTLKINGESRMLQVEPRDVLLDVLRESLGLCGTKKGCDH